MIDDLKREMLKGRLRTTLLPTQQLERTLSYAETRMRGEFEFALIGVVRQSTRLFNRRDIVTYFLNNGGGSRYQVYAVSSKGYTVFGLHMHFQAFVWPIDEAQPTYHPRRVDIIYDGPGQLLTARQVLDEWRAGPARHREIIDTLCTTVAERR